MPVSYLLRRYRTPLLLFIICLVAVISWRGSQLAYMRVAITPRSVGSRIMEVLPLNNKPLTKDVQKTVLKNGLTILTKEVHSSPVVTLQVWYKLGSRDEETGLNGIAHQLEHVMFQGTKKRPIQFGRLFNALGGEWNAFTGYDHTAYYETVESNKLFALLELEADRLRNALINAKALEIEKRVVISELQGYENSVDYRLGSAILKQKFPNHAYGLPVGGTKADVQKLNVEQVRKYYRNFYRPDNAVLVIVGDFNRKKTMEMVGKTFGKIPKPLQPIKRTRIAKTLDSYKIASDPIVLKEPGNTALVQAVYPIPDVNHEDIPVLDVINYILSMDKNSYLERALVKSGLATEIKTYLPKLSAGGWYEILVKANPKQDLSKIDDAMKVEVAKLAQQPVTQQEVKRAQMKLTASLILDNRDITNQGIQLGNDETVTGDYRYTDKYLAALNRVSVGDVQRVNRKYLNPEVRTVGFFQPTFNYKDSKSPSSLANSSTGEIIDFPEHQSTINEVEEKDFIQTSEYLPIVDCGPMVQEPTLPQQFSLDNGLKLLLLPDQNTPTVTLNGYIKAGQEFDPENKGGLAAMVAANLMSGTREQDGILIANNLASRGAGLEFESYREGVAIQGSSLSADLPMLIRVLADVIKNPIFPEKELEISRKKALSKLAENSEDPTAVAIKTFVQSVYPKHHPLHKFPSDNSLNSINREDLISFNAKHYRPESTTLVLTGNFEMQQVYSLIQEEFSDWKAKIPAPSLKYPNVDIPENLVQLNPVVNDKAQAITYIGHQGIKRQDSRYYATLVLNQILGGDTVSSRLGAEIRDRQGLTYGIYSSVNAGNNFGTFAIEMQTAPEDARQAIASTRKLMEDLHCQGVTAREVEAAKRTLISSYNVSLAQPEELANQILMNEVYGFTPGELHKFTAKIKDVSLKQVNKVARELLDPDKIIVVTTSPSAITEKGYKQTK
ncbi:ZINC PROTEASE [Richelia intracellularis HM01]|uniref:M16 family metallopeptidase n=1 Tax=Richelia intracellularis TaxID=1164990 RepID=UPI0002B54028|nr:pitrilysin family protein [Richelia intracellularis]CCH65745.1 ZINC PROTEASE [Richelia intracellularis HM01]